MSNGMRILIFNKMKELFLRTIAQLVILDSDFKADASEDGFMHLEKTACDFSKKLLREMCGEKPDASIIHLIHCVAFSVGVVANKKYETPLEFDDLLREKLEEVIEETYEMGSLTEWATDNLDQMQITYDEARVPFMDWEHFLQGAVVDKAWELYEGMCRVIEDTLVEDAGVTYRGVTETIPNEPL
jgi:hypothetical protein